MKVSRLLELAYGEPLSEEACCEYLSRVGLCAREYVSREIDSTLSGGELKRIEIATLLARKPKLAIFDEPEAGIDLWSFAMLVDTFDKLRQTGDQTVIIISTRSGFCSWQTILWFYRTAASGSSGRGRRSSRRWGASICPLIPA